MILLCIGCVIQVVQTGSSRSGQETFQSTQGTVCHHTTAWLHLHPDTGGSQSDRLSHWLQGVPNYQSNSVVTARICGHPALLLSQHRGTILPFSGTNVNKKVQVNNVLLMRWRRWMTVRSVEMEAGARMTPEPLLTSVRNVSHQWPVYISLKHFTYFTFYTLEQ